MVKYSIYPTLLDSFYWYNKMGATQEKFAELINKINRVKSEMPIAALKGVQFEDCINKQLSGQKLTVNGEGGIETENFIFGRPIIDKVCAKLIHAKKQQEYIQGIVSTSAGDVKVYGFIDYTYENMLVDLKTTGKYKIGKYAINNQHKAYPLLANLSGRKINQFNYLVTDFQHLYIETYDYCPFFKDEFIHSLEQFIEFLETNRNIITDIKIFGK